METAIVIGGGPAGLMAACHLADAGVRTTVLEAKARLGGRAASDSQDGFVLNQGPHALYAGGPAMRELKTLGVDPPRWNPVAPTRSVLIRGGETQRLAAGITGLAKLCGRMRRRPCRRTPGWTRTSSPATASSWRCSCG